MTLIDRVFSGSDGMYSIAVKAVDEALAKFGPEEAVAFPETAYSLPCIYAFTGKKISNLGELKDVLSDIRAMMTRERRTKDVFSSGIGTALAAEVIEAVKYVGGAAPYTGDYHGHLSDAEIRELGVPLVTKDIPGAAVLIGPAPSEAEAARIIKDYQSKGIIVFLVGGIIQQAVRAGVNMNFKVRVLTCGDDLSAVAHAISVTLRTAIIFGNVPAGDWDGMCKYTFERMFAFVNAYAPLDDMTVACGGGAIALGFPVITNETENIWRVPKSLIVQPKYEDFCATSLEARDIKIKITKVDVPLCLAAAFEGEIIRRGDMRVQMDGSKHNCFELCRSAALSEIEDHKIVLDGPDFDSVPVGGEMDIALIASVAGKNMQPDFEPVFERKFHNYLNCLEGVMHTGQRDLIRIRVSKSAYEAGFRAAHFGEVLYAKLKSDFENVVDKCSVTIVTDPEKCKDLRYSLANPIYDKRDERLKSLTDENVDKFYSCILCQSFSPSHVCVVTPERLGLCGAVSWLDARASNELNPNGPSRVITKGGLIDERLGQWQDVNDAVHEYSQGALDSVSLYSIMDSPMTSCGCFECICGIEPFSNGVVIVNREFGGMTPLGMTFSEMASMTGGGVQTPGFMGHGKHFIASKKFMKAEGGVQRIVWMPRHLKETVGAKLNQTAKELYGIDNFVDMIGDETVAEDPEALLAFLGEKGHPALSLEPMM